MYLRGEVRLYTGKQTVAVSFEEIGSHVAIYPGDTFLGGEERRLTETEQKALDTAMNLGNVNPESLVKFLCSLLEYKGPWKRLFYEYTVHNE